MNWKLNPRTGQMEPKITPQQEISKALAPIGQIPTEWIGIKTLREGVKICLNKHTYLAMSFNHQWRLLGIITNMSTIEKHLRGPLVNFHDAWLRGKQIDEPKYKLNLIEI